MNAKELQMFEITNHGTSLTLRRFLLLDGQ